MWKVFEQTWEELEAHCFEEEGQQPAGEEMPEAGAQWGGEKA